MRIRNVTENVSRFWLYSFIIFLVLPAFILAEVPPAANNNNNNEEVIEPPGIATADQGK